MGITSAKWHMTGALAFVVLVFYLAFGEHARIVCDICTTVPPAVYTYLQMEAKRCRIYSYKATLSYWILQSGMFVIDNVYSDTFNFTLGKFALLMVFFVIILRQGHRIKMFVEPSVSSYRTTLTSVKKGEGSSSEKSKENHVYTYWSPASWFRDEMEEQKTLSGQMKVRTASRLNERGALLKTRQAAKQSNSEESVALFDEDLTTIPCEVTFESPFDNPRVVTVTNETDRTVMWALKSNAVHILSAHPICGVIKRKSKIKLKLGVRTPSTDILRDRIDCVAIDYNFSEKNVTKFDRSFLLKSDPDRRRKKVMVYYKL